MRVQVKVQQESEPNMKTLVKLIVGSTVALGLGVVISGCSPRAGDSKEDTPPPVQVSYPVEREVTENSDLTGRTAAVDSVEVRARVWGYLDKVNFKEGMLVKKDDVLFEIDPRTYKAVLTQAEGNLAAAEARQIRLDADLRRAASLFKSNALSREDYDKTIGDRGETVGSISALRGAVEQARLDLDFTKVRAPISGRVGRAIVTQGNLVQSGQSGGTLLTTLVSVDPIYAYFDVDERTVLRVRQLIREGKVKSARDVAWPVFLGLANEEGYPHKGTIDFVDNQVNAKVGTLRLRGVFPNPDEVLTPGYFVRVRVPIGYPHKALLISERAIDADQGQRIVYVVGSDSQVAVRTVRLGTMHDGLREITEGLTTGDRVIVTGIQQIRPGLTVAPKVVAMPSAPKNIEVASHQ
jgi:RND family efflux transporter MFP subunit